MTEQLDDIPEFEPEEEQLLDRGVMVYGVADPDFCGIITAILVDVNDCVTYRVNGEFYYANELTTDTNKENKLGY